MNYMMLVALGFHLFHPENQLEKLPPQNHRPETYKPVSRDRCYELNDVGRRA